MSEYDFSWCAGPATTLLNQLLEKLATWEKCRRWYKWLSIIQLFIAYVLVFVSAALFKLAVTLIRFSDGCQSTGDSPAWFNQLVILCAIPRGLMWAISWIVGIVPLLGSVACYGGSWLFLALTFIFVYEEIDLFAPIEYFTLMDKKQYPTEMNLYKQMDRKTARVGTIKVYEIIKGQHVYTGWIRTMDEEPKWLYCNRRGKMIFDRFATAEEAEQHISSTRPLGYEEVSVPVSGDMRKVYPSVPIHSLEVLDLDAPEALPDPTTVVQYADDTVYPTYYPPLSSEENV
jgi:hypothetical protein